MSDSIPDLFGDAERQLPPPPRSAVHGPAFGTPSVRLPSDLAKALTFLSDEDIHQLASAVAQEQARRRPTASEVALGETSAPKKATSSLSKTIAQQPLTASRVNVIRAAFKAGVKPSTIARQFGVSLSAVRQALDKP